MLFSYGLEKFPKLENNVICIMCFFCQEGLEHANDHQYRGYSMVRTVPPMDSCPTAAEEEHIKLCWRPCPFVSRLLKHPHPCHQHHGSVAQIYAHFASSYPSFFKFPAVAKVRKAECPFTVANGLAQSTRFHFLPSNVPPLPLSTLLSSRPAASCLFSTMFASCSLS